MQPQIIIDRPHHNAENPLWHPQQQCLYWTDIPQGEMFRYYPHNDTWEQIYRGEPVGGFTIQSDGSLLLFKQRGAIEIWQEGNITILLPELPAEIDTRFNDAIADPYGRVFSGTMATPQHPGSLYRFDPDGSFRVVLENLLIPNGMGFSPDYRYFYCTDSDRRTISRFRYDLATGDLSDREIFIETPEHEGVPDGMAIDAEGYIWSARWDGKHLFRYNLEGQEVLRIPFPALKVSSLTFGGTELTDIYVTTAGGYDRATEGTGAGAIFHLQANIPGMERFNSKITKLMKNN
jgi:D-xylono/L-arabinono-1,4-lactonase